MMKFNNGCLIKVHRKWKWYQPVSYLSVMIRLFTRSYWNHTAVGVLINNHKWVLDANQKGVVLEPWHIWVNRYGHKVWEIKPSDREIAQDDVLKFVGRPYDYLSVFVWQPIYILTGIWLGKKGDSASKATYCTEIYSFLHGLKDAHLLTTADLD